MDATVGRVVRGVGPPDAAPRYGGDAKSTVGGFVAQTDATDVLVQERHDRALAVVVERSDLMAHGGIRVPVLPDRGGAVVDHVEPRRWRVPEQQLEGHILVAAIDEYRQQERRRQEACRQM